MSTRAVGRLRLDFAWPHWKLLQERESFIDLSLALRIELGPSGMFVAVIIQATTFLKFLAEGLVALVKAGAKDDHISGNRVAILKIYDVMVRKRTYLRLVHGHITSVKDFSKVRYTRNANTTAPPKHAM